MIADGRSEDKTVNNSVTVTDLLNDPARFDNRSVAVLGWFVFRREHCAIHTSPLDSKSSANAIWLVHPETIGGTRAVAALNRNWIRAVGIFNNRRQSGCGHFNAFPAQLTGLSELQRIEPTSDGDNC